MMHWDDRLICWSLGIAMAVPNYIMAWQWFKAGMVV